MEEMVFSMVVVNKIKPELKHKVTKDFLVHHIASAIMGWLALYFCTRAPGTGPVGVGVVGTGESSEKNNDTEREKGAQHFRARRTDHRESSLISFDFFFREQ